ncbi:MAG TPA: AAA family ATPase [Bradyrhizobium sp.]|nr:AAA family ATPase [Bradyrhizobium sp.]
MDLSDYDLETLHEGSATSFHRARHRGSELSHLLVSPCACSDSSDIAEGFDYEYRLAERLDSRWAVRPKALSSLQGRVVLVLDDPGGDLLSRCLRAPLDLGRVLQIAIGLSMAVRQAHTSSLIHGDIRPENVIVDGSGRVWLTGFSRAIHASQVNLRRRPQEPLIDSYPYMAPEQSGRMNRLADARSDLYSCGIVFYRMLTGTLPFEANDPMGWMHCHMARPPVPLRQRVPSLPQQIDDLVLKLLSKAAEERYQSAAGLEADLRKCLTGWIAQGRIDRFPLGGSDRFGALAIPGRLYGRDKEVQAIAEAFNRVTTTGATEVVILKGAAGAGKSALVANLQAATSSAPRVFAAGKFDQYKRNVPYATIAQAFADLVRQILTLDSGSFDDWRRRLIDALGPNAGLMVNLVPELTHILGDVGPPSELPPQETRSRFHVVFLRLLRLFAMPGRPLVLFIDDLQWLDSATIELIDRLSADEDVSDLLLICAFRDDEIGQDHAFISVLSAMRSRSRPPLELPLRPLVPGDIEQLISDALQSKTRAVGELARHVWETTAGNPFFAVQYLSILEDRASISYDADAGVWRWSTDGDEGSVVADDVTELLEARLDLLTPAARRAVEHLACLGISAPVATLAMALGITEDETFEVLRESVRERVVLRIGDIVSFAHDRVREVVYLLIPDLDRPKMHLAIARRLVSGLPAAARQRHLFDLAHQFSKGSALLGPADEIEDVAEIFLNAGRRAKLATAYASSQEFVGQGLMLLDAIRVERAGRILFALELEKAECEFVIGAFDEAEKRLLELASRAPGRPDLARIVRLQSSLYITLGRLDRAVEVALAFLGTFGIEWPSRPSESFLLNEAERMRALLGDQQIASLADLPVMTDPDSLAAMDVLASLILAAQLTDHNLEDLVLLRMVNLSLERGHCDASCYAYTSLNLVLGLRFGDYKAGLEFGKLGCGLVEARGLDRFKARTYCCFCSSVAPWNIELRSCLDLNRRTIGIASSEGDLVFVAATSKVLVVNLLFVGQGLAEVQSEAEKFLVLSRKMDFPFAVAAAIGQLLLIRELRGADFDDDLSELPLPDLSAFEKELEISGQSMAIPRSWHWVRQMQACYHAGRLQEAVELADRIRARPAVTRSFIEFSEYHFYAALSHAAFWDRAPEDRRPRHREALEEHRRQLAAWAASCPENYDCRAFLIDAEAARLDGCEIGALRGYEDACRAARERGFPQVEGIAAERAASLSRALGLRSAARLHLLDAHAAYLRWGAKALADRIDRDYPDLLGREGGPPGGKAPLAQFDRLDVAAVVEMAQVISGELLLDRLIERLMVTVVEHAGAVRGLLLLPREGEMTIVAEASTCASGVVVHRAVPEEIHGRLPQSILNLVVRTREHVILDDVSVHNAHSTDSYLIRARPRSVLCLPLIKQGNLSGVLYLENDLSPGTFRGNRLSVLQMLASQAAISIENAQLFQEVREAQEEARRAGHEFRLAFDMIPAQAWRASAEGGIEFANKRWHDYTGIPQDGSSLEETRPQIMHPDDLEKIMATWRSMLETGLPGEVEARIRRHDGEYRRFLLRASPMRDDSGRIIKWHGTNTDIQEMVRAAEAQEALARASRLTAMGELTVSIAHEINQPLMAIVTNAATCLRWLDDGHVDVTEARRAAERIIGLGHRAGDVISSIRAMARKTTPRTGPVDLNGAVVEVLQLMRGVLERHGVLAVTELSPGLLPASGDRVQLQQVLLNLIMNGIEAISFAAGAQRLITVRSGMNDRGFIEVRVTDTGVGIDPVAKDRLFDAFYTTKPEGVGIGLSICRSIIEQHGGSLSAHPETPSGATFRFSLPPAQEAA